MLRRVTARASSLCLLLLAVACAKEDGASTDRSTITVYEGEKGASLPLETHSHTDAEFAEVTLEQPRMSIDGVALPTGGRGTVARLRAEGRHTLVGLDEAGQAKTEAVVTTKRLAEGGVAIEVIEPSPMAGTTFLVREPEKCSGIITVTSPLLKTMMTVDVDPSEKIGCDASDYVLSNLFGNMLLGESFAGGWEVVWNVTKWVFTRWPHVLAAAALLAVILQGFSWWTCTRVNAAVITGGDARYAAECPPGAPRLKSRHRNVSGGACPFIGTQVPATHNADCDFWPPAGAGGAPAPAGGAMHSFFFLDGGMAYPPDAGIVYPPDGGIVYPPDASIYYPPDAGVSCDEEICCPTEYIDSETGEEAETWEPSPWDGYYANESESYPCPY